MTGNSKVWLAAFVTIVFATGALAGIIVDRRWRFAPPPASAGIAPLPGLTGRGGRGAGLTSAEVAEINANRLDRALRLTAEQRAAVVDILRRRDERIRSLQDQTRQQFVAEQRALQEEVSAVLTPEQRERFQNLRGRLLGPGGARNGLFGRGDGRAGGRGRRGGE
ncbi:MAG: hypothetical protein IT184_01015 [Acidobacteria bacterium]|nr:hypothetical protein [Acidobacteriota bacterium]